MHPKFKTAFFLFIASICIVSSSSADDLGHLGSFAKWGEIEISFDGPPSESAGDPNPFEVSFDVTFVGPSGQTYEVPGFYDGDGNGGPDGNVWRVRFAADEVGDWEVATSSDEALLDGVTGSFGVSPIDPQAAGFYRWGRLESVGTAENQIRYFKFRDGPYWMKAGADDPENFLGSFENYDTLDERIEAIDYLADLGINSLYIMTHNIDGDENDVWPWLGDTKSDGKDNGKSGDVRFDIPRLTEWRALFEHMQRQGVATYLVLEDDSAWTGYDRDVYYRELVARFGDLPAVLFNICEEHNERYSLSQAIGFAEELADLDPYGHPIAIHNENNAENSDGEDYLMAAVLSFTSIQTGDHGYERLNNTATEWIDEALNLGVRVPLPNFDEARPEEERGAWWAAYLGGGVWEAHVSGPWDRPMDAWDDVWTELGGARAFMESMPFWSMLPRNDLISSGDGYCLAEVGETYAVYLESGSSITLDLAPDTSYDYAWWNPDNGYDGSFQDGGTVEGGSRTFTRPGSGDWALLIENSENSQNERPVAVISSPESGDVFRPGEAVFFDGSQSYDLDGSIDEYRWDFDDGSVEFGMTTSHSFVDEGSYTVRLVVEDDDAEPSQAATVEVLVSASNVPPLSLDQNVTVVEDWLTGITPSFVDADGPGPYALEVVAQPANGRVRVAGMEFEYKAEAGFRGSDSFAWRVYDGADYSDPATVQLSVEDNVAPIATDFNLLVPADTAVEFSMLPHVLDADGPANPQYRLVGPPQHGRVTGDRFDNDFTYTPAPGFTGVDAVRWRVFDGLDRSNVATINVFVAEPGMADDFERTDSEIVGGAWVEFEVGADARTAIENAQLVFHSSDEDYRPLITHALSARTTGTLSWSFDVDFARNGGESIYAFHMQLGDGSMMDQDAPLEDGIAVNLVWGGRADGLDDHEGLGYVVDGVVTQVAQSSGLVTLTIAVDLDAQSYDILLDGVEVGTAPFDDDVPIDSMRFFAHRMNDSNFDGRSVDNISVQ